MSIPSFSVLSLSCRSALKAMAVLAVFGAATVFAEPDAATQARLLYLQGLNLAQDGSKPEALKVLAQSLRLQRENNPAAALAFQLLAELKQGGLTLRGHTKGIRSASYSKDGTKIVTGSEDQTARIWDAKTGVELVPPMKHESEVALVSFSSDGTQVLTLSEDVKVWDAKTGALLHTLIEDDDDIKFAGFTPDGKRVATGAEEGHGGRIIDVETGKDAVPPLQYRGTIFGITFSTDGTLAAVASGDDRTDLLNAATGKKILESMRSGNRVYTSVLSPDNTRILSASADRTARIWDTTTGKEAVPSMEHGYWLTGAVFNADASRVATGSWDHTARVWDAQTGKPVTPPMIHGDAVQGVAFSPDGTMVATASRDHTARIWDAKTGDALFLPWRKQDEVTKVLFSPDGASLLVISKDKIAEIWDMPPRTAPPAWLADLAEFASTQVKYDESRVADMTSIMKLRETLLASDSKDSWDRFGRWYFAEADVRPISPWGTISLVDYVEGLIARGDRDSLDYATTLSKGQSKLLMKLQAIRDKGNMPPAPAPSASPEMPANPN